MWSRGWLFWQFPKLTVGMACVWNVWLCHCTTVWWLLVWHVFGMFGLPLYNCLMTVGMACVRNVWLCHCTTVWWLLVWHVLGMFGLLLYNCLMTVGMACVRNIWLATVQLSDDCWYGMCLEYLACHCTTVWWLLVWHVSGMFGLALYHCLMTVGMACVRNVWPCLCTTVWRLLADAAALPQWKLLRVSAFLTYWVCVVLVWNVQIFLWRRWALSEAACL